MRIDAGRADALIGCDIVVSSSPKASACYRRGTRVVLNLGEMPTGDIVRQRDASLRVADARGGDRRRRSGAENLAAFDANRAAERLLGDSVFANVMMLGFAWQQGLVPVSLRGAVAGDRAERRGGRAQPRRLRHRPAHGRATRGAAARARATRRRPETLDELIARRAAFLADYQDAAYAERFRARIAAFRAALPGRRRRALTGRRARSLFKLMAYKDEYEVARLHTRPGLRGEARRGVRGRLHASTTTSRRRCCRSGRDARGRPRKRAFGPWMRPALPAARPAEAAARHARSTCSATPPSAGWSAALIGWYEALLDRCAGGAARRRTATPGRAILAAPMDIRGYGPVKDEAVRRVRAEVAALTDAGGVAPPRRAA